MKNSLTPSLLSLLVIGILLSSCSSNESGTVMLANNMDLELRQNEKVIENNTEVVEFHDSVFNSYGALNWPLYKALEGKNYRSFVGVPIETNSSQLIEMVENDDSNRIIEKYEGDSTSFIKYQKGDLYIVSVIADYNKFLWTLSATSEDSTAVSFLFDPEKFSNRVKSNE
ncbi:hypothetical protein [Halocola ammonii]